MSKQPNPDIDEKLRLIEVIRKAINQDKVLREKYKIGNKFRFVNERLQKLITHLESSIAATQSDNTSTSQGLAEDEVPVYVYLYNSQGLQIKSWQNLLTPKVFYEYSVNRPIYGEKKHIDALLRSKVNKAQHAYLTVAVKRNHILVSGQDSTHKDAIGNPVIKVKEGSLHFEKLLGFTHQDIEYRVVDGELISV